MLRLCEDGRLSLDDPLARWYSDVDRAQSISLRQLLNHTGGIPDYGGLATYHESVRINPSQPWSFERFAAETFDRGLLFEPGQGWAYSNPGYMLVKRVIEGVTGDSYRTLIAEHIAGPLGLRRTFVPESIADLTTLAAGMSSLLASDATSRDARSHYHPGWVSHGVVASTASDQVRFLNGLFRGRLLSQDSLDQMLTLIPVIARWDQVRQSAPASPGATRIWARRDGRSSIAVGFDRRAQRRRAVLQRERLPRVWPRRSICVRDGRNRERLQR